MCYTCLSVLDDIISKDKIQKLKEYFLGLTPNSRDLITVSKIARAIGIDCETAVQIILKCEEKGVLQRHFGIRCPNCGMLIKEIASPCLDGIFINECYSCDEEISISEKDIVILFKLIKVEIPFESGQQRGQNIEERTSIVAQEDTFESFKVMCKAVTDHCNEKRIEQYKEKIEKANMKKIHVKAIKIAERNRKINIILNSICLVIDIIIIYLVYIKFGFSKLSIFTGFTGFIVPFICNTILKEIFLVDGKRIEEKLLLKE